ncbi:MAG TPA: MerR family transcriptional regulator [Acidimicrobiales bacterium]|jgi:DNA-binding transcriptional MerR regulator|nr:MerR family transcriptional regulator [Acidimicrobiales bacterium]
MTSTTTGLRISELSERTGFSGPTLRYYEQIGLLPAPDRTGAGYRVYGDGDVARLNFIARAKRLGCSLDEIRGLVESWDHDRCAPVQHQLRFLVGSKLNDAQTQIADLRAFTAELQVTAAQLATEPVDGACGDGCACVAEGAGPEAGPDAVQLGVRTAVDAGVPIACSLAAGDMADRLADWQAVTDHVVRREDLDGGIRLLFGDDAPLGVIVRLAAAEYECCPFFAFALTVDNRGIALEVTAPPDGAEVLTAAFGTAGCWPPT